MKRATRLVLPIYDAYATQLENFAQNVLQDRTPPITIDDGLEALRIGVAATRAQESGAVVAIDEIRPAEV
jgi:predicted dehydrogenase